MNCLAVIIVTIVAISGCQPAKEKEETKEEAPVVIFVDSLAIPDFTMATIADSTVFSSSSIPKKGLVLIKYFSPDCDHCQAEAELYFSKKDSLQNIKTIWLSGAWAELDMIKEFSEKYQLDQLNPIAIGKEPENQLLVHYEITGTPYSLIYEDNQLITKYDGDVNFDELIYINNRKLKSER